MNRIAKVAGLALSATILTSATLPAEAHRSTRVHSHQVEQADRMVREFRPTYVEPYRNRTRWFVEFSDGSAWKMVPCAQEDSPNCFWDAAKRGNRRGWAFINVKGITFRLWRA